VVVVVWLSTGFVRSLVPVTVVVFVVVLVVVVLLPSALVFVCVSVVGAVVTVADGHDVLFTAQPLLLQLDPPVENDTPNPVRESLYRP
ncbi:hypothetical protein NQ024_11805, partial [Corynebacterium sp. 35RC1]|nr:hypothetical protein [Corynebacterium sp. 35RC1]